MGTKKEPGKYDCYAKAELDEPLFVLLARDKTAPQVVRHWILLQPGGNATANLPEKLREAYSCADAMQEWHKKNPRA